MYLSGLALGLTQFVDVEARLSRRVDDYAFASDNLIRSLPHARRDVTAWAASTG